MMRKAGYLERNGRKALDEDGTPCEVVEVRIDGTRYGIRAPDLKLAIVGTVSVRVERLRQNWKPYLGGIAGLVMRSRSGRALNFEMISGEKFTVSLDAACSVLSRKERYALVFWIPAASARAGDQQVSGDRQLVLPGVQ